MAAILYIQVVQKRMIRVVDTEPEMTKFASGSAGSTIRKCAFRNTDGTALEMWEV